jgi:stringent starvation protein B
MIPKRPYFLRAFYDWITDNGLTAHLVVDANYQDVSVPQAYVENGKIVLNASMSAVQSLVLDDEYVSFSARFAGKSFNIYLPIFSILGIYAAENGEGIVLAEMDTGEVPPVPTTARVKPTLSAAIVEVVDSSESSASIKTDENTKDKAAVTKIAAKTASKKRPSHLKVVK